MKYRPNRNNTADEREGHLKAKVKGRRRISRRAKVATGLTFVAAAASLTHILSNLTESAAPEVSSQLWPGNDSSWARAASLELAKIEDVEKALVGGNSTSRYQDESALEKMRYFSEQSIRSSIVQENGFRNLAYVALLEGEPEKSERIARAAYTISRRDAATQLLLVLRALSRGEIGPALRNIDEALRTSASARDPLYAALAQALISPEFIEEFRPYVRADNEWLAGFLAFALENRIEVATVGQIIAEAGPLPERPGTSIRAMAPVYLVAEDEITLARRIAEQLPATLSPAQAGGLSDPTFREREIVEPFGWTMTAGSAISIQRSNGGPFALSATSGIPYSGEVLRQLLVLPPGRYRFAYDGELGDNSAWILRCTNSGKSLISTNGADSHIFMVPVTECEGQWLTLESRALGPVDIKIRSVRISRE